jgi:prepilin signal peptidase PulO-like enzyme (type II secretory pathway)
MTVRALEAAAIGATTFAAVAVLEGTGGTAIARLAICGAALGAAAASDLTTRRIPNRVTMPAALLLLTLWATTGAEISQVAAGVGVACVLCAIGLVKPEAMGMGDAKLALVVALGLTDKALIGLASGILLAAIVAAARLASTRDATSAVPLGPFLALGALLALAA